MEAYLKLLREKWWILFAHGDAREASKRHLRSCFGLLGLTPHTIPGKTQKIAPLETTVTQNAFTECRLSLAIFLLFFW